MKKTLTFLAILICTISKAQVSSPQFINYQAILRDPAGVPIAVGTTVNLNVKIFNSSAASTPSYEEDHNSITVPSGNVINIQIGKGVGVAPNNTFSAVQWNLGQAEYLISLNGTPLGSRTPFASVPFALNVGGGGALPPGSANQTLYYDGNTNTWKATNNLANDGNRVGLGVGPNTRAKFHVMSSDPLDTTLIYATKFNANAADALYRGIISGQTTTSAASPFAPIIGADIRSINNGNGYAVGIGGSGSVTNGGTAIGVSATAKGTGSSTLIGLYASADTLGNPNAYAALFDKGNVLVNDAIVFPNASVPAGSIYKLDPLKRGYWGPPGTTTVSINQGGIVNVNPNGPGTNFTVSAQAPVFQSSGIGTIIPSSYPNYILSIPAPSFSFNSSTGIMNYAQGTLVTSVNLSPSLSVSSGTFLTVAGSGIGIPQLGFWVKPTNTVLCPGNLSDNVGIGLNNPGVKLEVAGNTKFSDPNTVNGFVSIIQNNNSTSGQGSGVLRLTNNFARSISNQALLVENFATKVGGSGTTKTGIDIESTGSWAPGTGQPNVGLLSNVGGADFNYAGIFTGGQVGINNPNPKTLLSVAGSIALKKVTTSGTYSMSVDDCIVEYTAGGTITLPPSGSCDEGHHIVIRNRSAVTVTLIVQGSDYMALVGGGATLSTTSLAGYAVLNFYKSGIGWIQM
jgi:hypothetical protein